jgi:putative peptidoglycan lipid II flippase
VAVVVNVTLNFALVWRMGLCGLALSTVLCSYLQAAALLAALYRRLGASLLQGLLATTVKTAAASLFCWLAGALLLQALLAGLPPGRFTDVLALAAVVAVSVIAYVVASAMLRIEAFYLIIGRTRPQGPLGR